MKQTYQACILYIHHNLQDPTPWTGHVPTAPSLHMRAFHPFYLCARCCDVLYIHAGPHTMGRPGAHSCCKPRPLSACVLSTHFIYVPDAVTCSIYAQDPTPWAGQVPMAVPIPPQFQQNSQPSPAPPSRQSVGGPPLAGGEDSTVPHPVGEFIQ